MRQSNSAGVGALPVTAGLGKYRGFFSESTQILRELMSAASVLRKQLVEYRRPKEYRTAFTDTGPG